MKIYALLLTVVFTCCTWQAARAQGCAGVTATQEDGSVLCFPPVTQYMESMGNVVTSGNGLSMASEYNATLQGVDAVCIGCSAIVFSAPEHTSFSVLAYERNGIDGSVTGYQHSYIPARYDPVTNRSTLSYVPHLRTTVISINVLASNYGDVDIEPVWAHVD